MRNYKIKQVYFNLDKDEELYTHANTIKNFSDWAKKHLQTEINNSHIEDIVEKLLEQKLPKQEPIKDKSNDFDGFI